jgi:DNA-binding HxlR family transcriptional regulator
MLTQQLRELERDGIVTRTIYAEIPPRVEYALTDFGRTLAPVIEKMHEWGTTYVERVIEQKQSARARPLQLSPDDDAEVLPAEPELVQ